MAQEIITKKKRSEAYGDAGDSPEEALDAKLRNLLLILVGHMPERHILSGEQFGGA